MINFTNLIKNLWTNCYEKQSAKPHQLASILLSNTKTTCKRAVRTPIQSRLDSVSIVCRQSDLAKYVATLVLFLCLGVGQMWGANQTYTVENPVASKRYVQDNIMVTGTVGTSKKIANSSQNVFYVQNGNYAPLCIISKAANIKGIQIYGNRDTGSSSQGNAFNLQTSSNAIDFSVPSSGFTATKKDNGDPAALASLTNVQMIGNNQSYATTITVSFSSPVMAIRLIGATSVSIKSVVVTYDDAITVDPELCEVHMTSATAAALTGTGTWTATNIQSGNNYTDASSNTYYYDKSSGTYGKIDLGSGNTFQEGDEIWFDMNGNGLRAPGACGYKLNSSNSTSGAVTIQPTCTIAANMPMYMHYITKSTDPWVGQQVLWILRYDSNDRLYQVTIHRAAGSCAATANAGADKSTTVGVGVAMAATAATSGYTGAWSIKTGSPNTSTSQLSSTSSNTATFTPTTYGTYTLVWTVTDDSDGSCTATDEATVTVPAPTHDITYTNLKGADNSANPTTYAEGTGVASFTKLRHVVGYDFTGWSPSSISSSATTDQTIDAQWTTRAAAAGTGTLTYAFTYSDNNITSAITRNNGALYDATDLTWTNVTIDDSESAERSGKITTTTSYDGSKYLSLTFKIADGYTFTPTEVQLKAVAVSNDKTIRFEFKDNAGTPNTKYLEQTRTNGSSVGTLTYDFDASDPVTLTGTVTVKIYAYGNTNSWRLGTPLTITGTVASSAICPDKYSFHYGPTTGDWETPICFEQVGSTHEWNITNFTIPSHSGGKFWVGHHGETNSQSATKAWTDSYSDGNGAMKLLPTSNSIVGQATGAVGTINIWDDSGWQNQNVGFTPNGYGITYGGSGHAFHTTATNHMWETDVVTLPNVSTTYNIGLATATAGTYVKCAHSKSTDEAISAMGVTVVGKGGKAIYLVPGPFNADGAKYAVYDVTNTAFDTDFMSDADGDGIYVGYVGSNCTSMILCRMNSDATTSDLSSKNWDKRWNQTANISISGDLAKKYTITNMTTWNECGYSTANMQPITGQKGKFRMWDDSGSDNWYVHWIPYYVLSYDANGGSDAPSAQSVSSEASPCQLTVSSTEPTRTDYIFEGWSTSSSAVSPDGAWDPGDTHAMTGDVTLYAVWTHCSGPSISAFSNSEGRTYTVGDAATTMTITASAGNGGTLHYHWYQYNVGQDPLTESIDAVGYTDASTYTPSTASAHAGQIFYCVVSEEGCSTTVKSAYSGAIVVNAATYTLTVSGASVANPMTEESKTGTISGVTITGSPVSGIASGTTTSTSDNTFTVNKGTPVTVTASATVSGSAAECDECTYRFKEWTNVPASVTANVSNIQAVYNTTYTIAFRETDGTTIAGASDTYYVYGVGKTVATFPTPTKSGYEFGGWYKETSLTNAATDLSSSDYGNITYYAKWIEIATLACGTLYEVEDMVPASITLSTTGQYASGLSSNGIFTTIGDPSKTDGAAGTPEMKNESSTTIAGESFIGRMYFKGASNTTGSGTTFVPTSRAIKFAIAKNGTLDIYAHRVDRLYLKKAGESGTTQLGSSTSSTPSKVSHSVTDGTYYIYSDNSNDCVYGMQLNCAHTVTYKANGSGESDVVDDAAATIAANPFTWSGHTFVGWNTADDGSGTPYTVGATVTGDLTLYAQWKSNATVYAFSNGSFGDWGTCSGGTLTLVNSQTGVSYQLYKDGVASGDPKAGTTGSAINWTVTANGTYTVKSVANATYAETAMTGTAVVTLQDPALSGSSTVNIGSTITLTHPGYLISGGSWTSSNGSVATVVDGVVTGVAAGTATITFHGVGSCDGSKEITVTEPSDCEDLAIIAATSTSALAATVGSVSYGSMTGGDGISIDGYSYSVKFNSSGHVDISPKAGETFAAGDSLIVVIYNHGSSEQAIGFKIGSNDYTATTDGRALHYFRQTLVAANISDGKVIINRSATNGSSGYIVAATIKRCGLLPTCTTPTIPSLSDQTVCPGSDIAAWDATVSNAAAISAAGESVAYSWKKKGSDTELVNTASLDLGSSATEGMTGTYVVTVTVSADGKASTSASKEVTLTVTPATEEPAVTQSPAKVYVSDDVTLTATCGSAGTITWAWYTCNSDGTGELVIAGKTTATCAITAPAIAGTYYYKVKATGDGTNACGTAEHVHALTVKAASECENYFWFTYSDDATTNGVINNRSSFFTGAPTGSSNQGSYKFTVDGTEYTATRNTGSTSISISFTVPEGSTADFVMNGKSSSSNTVTLSHSSGTPSYNICASGSYAAYSQTGLTAGTWTLTAGSNWTLAALAVHVCHESTCTDAVPEIAAVNNTVCVGTKMRIDATGYEAGATFQWQKLNSGTSSWDNVSRATLDSLVIASATASDAGSYRLIATKGCARTSNTVTISVPSAPNFGSTVPASVSVMQTLALSISTVEATDAVKYRWYKSADNTWDAGDVEIGTDKTLIKAYDGETAGSTYYIFCRAQNACGITTSSAITVNVTAYVEEDCATKGNEGEAQFGFENTSCSQGTYSSESAWYTNSRTKYLTYTAPEGKYFDEAKVRIAVSSGSKCGYAYSTDGGTTWTYAEKTGLSSDLADITIDLTGNVNAFRIGRNLQDGRGTDWGVTSGNFYLTKACFTYINACTATTVTPSTSSKTHTIGDTFTKPTFTLAPAAVSGETLTYSSSNEDIASVDDDGTVTFQDRAGTVTITAAYAGGEISSTQYCASEGSYTITVSCSDEAPKVVPASGTNMSGCNSSVTLNAKMQNGTSDFGSGTYQWFRDGEEISGATSSSYIAVQAGTYTVERIGAGGCTSLSTNSVVITSETTEPEVERLVPFQYYHVNKTYTAQMKMRHLFAVKNSGKLDGKSFKLYVSRNGGAATDVTNSNALAIWTNADGRVDTVMIDLNKLATKYSENDELVYTCKAVDCSGNVSEVYKANVTLYVIGATPTLALICSGSDKANGTRKTGELTVGGDFLTGYNKADLCQQTGNTSFDASTEWGLYTRLKANYIVTPVNGYAIFNKLNYEPFDILLLTDYPKASKSDAAATVLDDMADLVDFRPMLSLKAHMVSKSPSKWAAKGFTTAPMHVTGGDGRIYMNIVCYAHPMFDGIKEAGDHIFRDHDEKSQIVYEVLTEPGYENSKGLQGFEIDAAENFVTIGLIHYNATAAEDYPTTGELSWTPGSKDRMLVAAVERQTNLEARLIVLAVNCGAQSKFTETGRTIVHKCLEYLLSDATDPITPVADCAFTFDNGAGAPHDAAWYKVPANCPGCSGTLGDGLWTTEANWGPDRINIPSEFTSARIAAAVTVDTIHAKALELRIVEGGRITIPAGSALDVKSTIRRFDGSEISPTEVSDIFIGSTAAGNGTLIFNNDKGDSKARVQMYSTAQADIENMSAATSTWQYIGTPHNDIANAQRNYYDSWLYQYDTGEEGWTVIPNGGPLIPFRGYCVTHPSNPNVYDMEGTLVATTSQEIAIPAGKYVVVANSWVAPIDINAITDDDMEGMTDKTIYFFNTGTDTDGTGETGTAAGTYRASPINAASYTGDWQIPSMQGFYVVGGSSDGTLHLDYSRHVRPSTERSIVGNPMYAPRRSAENNEPEVAKLYFRGHRYYDRLIVLEREDFTRGYDSGWDGEAWGGNDASPMSYVSTEGRWDAVSAVPEYEGTIIGFRAGEDNEYLIDFVYSSENEPLYLLDTENNTYSRVLTGNAYRFATSDKEYHERFVLTRKNPNVATEIETVSGDELRVTGAKKLLIEDKMFILLNGMLYDATGKVVK